MVFEIVEALREQISEMNDKILASLKALEVKESLDTALQTHSTQQDAPMTYTPVTKETFAVWCASFMERLKQQKEEKKTEDELKPTGR